MQPSESESTFRIIMGSVPAMVAYLILSMYALGTMPNLPDAVIYASYWLGISALVMVALGIRWRSLLWRYLLLSAYSVYLTACALPPI